MLVSHTKKFIYTKTKKTAGTSVESYFEKYCLLEGTWEFFHNRPAYVGETGIIGYRGGKPPKGEVWRNHMPAKKIKRIVGDEIWNSYFKFCVIRDPFDKMVSGFHFYYRRKQRYALTNKLNAAANRLIGKSKPIDRVSGSHKVDRFRSWVKLGGWVKDRNKYIIDGQECVDFFIRFEDLEGGIRSVCERLEIPFEPERIPRLKHGNRIDDLPLNEYYDKETIQIVSDRYRFELDRFGYTAPEPCQ